MGALFKLHFFVHFYCISLFIFLGFVEAYSREQTKIVQKIVSEHNGSDFVFAEDPEAKKELWKVWLLVQ